MLGGFLEALRAEAAPGPDRADILFELALNYSWGAPTAIALCDEARSEAGADVRLTRILGVRSFYGLLGLGIRQGVSDAREALAGAERIGDPRLIAGRPLMLTAVTTRGQSALIVTFEDSSGMSSAEWADRAAFREFLASIRLRAPSPLWSLSAFWQAAPWKQSL